MTWHKMTPLTLLQYGWSQFRRGTKTGVALRPLTSHSLLLMTVFERSGYRPLCLFIDKNYMCLTAQRNIDIDAADADPSLLIIIMS